MAKANAKKNDVVDLDFTDLDEKQPVAPAVTDKPKRTRTKQVPKVPEVVAPIVPTFTAKQINAILDSANLIAKELLDGPVTEDTLKTTYAKALRIAMKTNG